MTTIHNKHVLVTGGASGMGRLLALRCAGMGATVTIWDLDEDGGRAAAEQAAACGGVARSFACDVGDRARVYACAAETKAAAGPVDILVNNAGIVCGERLVDLPDERVELTFRVNALAPFWVTKAFLPDMIAHGAGHVVTVASAAGLMGSPRLSDYSASKHAAVGFNESLRLEMKHERTGVKTTVVCPYYVDTGMFAGVKTRFPLLLPILKETDVVERIVDAVQRDRSKVELPLMVRTLPAMRLLPVPVFDRLADFFGLTTAMDQFCGREPQGDAD